MHQNCRFCNSKADRVTVENGDGVHLGIRPVLTPTPKVQYLRGGGLFGVVYCHVSISAFAFPGV